MALVITFLIGLVIGFFLGLGIGYGTGREDREDEQ